MNAIFVPNLEAELIPGVSAAGFSLGDSFSNLMRLIGPVDWYEADAGIHDVLLRSKGWVGVRKKLGFDGGVVVTLTYMNSLILLAFECSEVLYRIVVGSGYLGTFNGVRVGDDLLSLEKNFEIDFNDVDDEFLILKDKSYIGGISFITNYRASLMHAPDQTIKFISVHDWDLR
ncbi:hypothetical protein [Pseudomonas sp. 6D_7.1_Bac1]|uniref:hypothetical protein n=1 Tax=Pseudomonas sp. 6D_7.1_Bac1 TaxID=2971615 RepID=UPI0021C83AD7|nr:hypothetical protein [Pseudomonas sp. 6D_7.1_Bac1]MCU1752422.1 hypothetical protein [Pseudomonas sp. 6D_7.1_Bac1]